MPPTTLHSSQEEVVLPQSAQLDSVESLLPIKRLAHVFQGERDRDYVPQGNVWKEEEASEFAEDALVEESTKEKEEEKDQERREEERQDQEIQEEKQEEERQDQETQEEETQERQEEEERERREEEEPS